MVLNMFVDLRYYSMLISEFRGLESGFSSLPTLPFSQSLECTDALHQQNRCQVTALQIIAHEGTF
jgi:hypothetical protein